MENLQVKYEKALEILANELYMQTVQYYGRDVRKEPIIEAYIHRSKRQAGID
jgi:hypothetical protein